MKTLLSLFLVSFFFNAIFALKCQVCDYGIQYNQDIKDGHALETLCNTEGDYGTVQNCSAEAKFCFKQSTVLYKSVDPVVLRSCPPEDLFDTPDSDRRPIVEDKAGCYTDTNGDNIAITVYLCEGDNCNSAPRLSLLNAWLFILPVLFYNY